MFPFIRRYFHKDPLGWVSKSNRGQEHIVLSHRVAGPIYKITKVIKEMRSDNKIYKITLRPNDEFQDLTKELNMLLEQFNEKSR